MMNDPADSLRRLLFRVNDVRAIDRAATDGGVDGYTLMTRAAQYALDVARAEFPEARHWQILCGPGNNAGDGYVLARLAAARGITVTVTTLADPGKLSGDARTAWTDASEAGVAIVPFDGTLDTEADLLVDALLGSGLTRDVDGRYADAIAVVAGHPAAVLSLDIPSGLDGDSGAVRGRAIRAEVTVTFVARKAGLYLNDGPEHCGRVHFSPLDIPPIHYRGVQPAASDGRRGHPPRRGSRARPPCAAVRDG